MNSFEERKSKRIERYKLLEAKYRDKAAQYQKSKDDISRFIPFGQPILVGHHSERRHRKDLERIDNFLNKHVEAIKKAEYYERRANNLENSTRISSDDPEAIAKLKTLLGKHEKNQEFMKALNKAWRSHGKPKSDNVEKWIAISNTPEILELEISKEIINKVRLSMAKDPLDRAPFTYQMTNNNSSMKRVRERIKYLASIESVGTRVHEIGEIQIKENREEKRVQIFFPEIPSVEVRVKLKARGFKWSRKNQCWQRLITESAVSCALEIIKGIKQ